MVNSQTARPSALRFVAGVTDIRTVWCLTDKDGQFTIDHLPLGTYEILAINEADGYSIDNQSPGHDVSLTTEQRWSSVTIRRQNRAGVLVGTVIDKTTGRKIDKAQIQYTAVDDGGSWQRGAAILKGQFRVTVPSDSDLLIVVMSERLSGLGLRRHLQDKGNQSWELVVAGPALGSSEAVYNTCYLRLSSKLAFSTLTNSRAILPRKNGE